MVQASEVCYTTVCLLKRKLVSCKNFILRENPIGCWFEGTELLGDVPVAFSDLSSPVYVISLKSSSDVPIDSNRCQSPTNHHDYRYYHRFRNSANPLRTPLRGAEAVVRVSWRPRVTDSVL